MKYRERRGEQAVQNQKQVEFVGESEREQRREARMREKRLADDPIMMREEGIQKRLSEKRPYFQWVPTKQEDSETDKLKAAVRALEEKVGRLQDRVYVLEGAGEERGWSSSEDEYGREWRWESGSWWFKIPAVRGVRVNSRCRRQVSRTVRQMLEQEGWRNGDERWNTWLKERKSGHGWSTGVNDDRVNGGGIFSTEADRTSRKPRAGDQGHVGVGREFQEPGTGSRAFSNLVVFM